MQVIVTVKTDDGKQTQYQLEQSKETKGYNVFKTAGNCPVLTNGLYVPKAGKAPKASKKS